MPVRKTRAESASEDSEADSEQPKRRGRRRLPVPENIEDLDSDEQKLVSRRSRNRQNAAASRLRRAQRMDDLERRVKLLSEDNHRLRVQLAEKQQEIDRLKGKSHTSHASTHPLTSTEAPKEDQPSFSLPNEEGEEEEGGEVWVPRRRTQQQQQPQAQVASKRGRKSVHPQPSPAMDRGGSFGISGLHLAELTAGTTSAFTPVVSSPTAAAAAGVLPLHGNLPSGYGAIPNTHDTTTTFGPGFGVGIQAAAQALGDVGSLLHARGPGESFQQDLGFPQGPGGDNHLMIRSASMPITGGPSLRPIKPRVLPLAPLQSPGTPLSQLQGPVAGGGQGTAAAPHGPGSSQHAASTLRHLPPLEDNLHSEDRMLSTPKARQSGAINTITGMEEGGADGAPPDQQQQHNQVGTPLAPFSPIAAHYWGEGGDILSPMGLMLSPRSGAGAGGTPFWVGLRGHNHHGVGGGSPGMMMMGEPGGGYMALPSPAGGELLGSRSPFSLQLAQMGLGRGSTPRLSHLTDMDLDVAMRYEGNTGDQAELRMLSAPGALTADLPAPQQQQKPQ